MQEGQAVRRRRTEIIRRERSPESTANIFNLLIFHAFHPVTLY
jgi:hypothetical protein